jgi:hypothetical protein
MTDDEPWSSYDTRAARDELEPGVPAVDELPRHVPPGSEDEETPPPLDHPQGADEWGTTEREALQGEPLELRVLREEPDVIGDRPPGGVSLYEPGTDEAVDDGGGFDAEPDLVADADVGDEITRGPEEQAVRVVDEPAGMNYDPTPGYVDDAEER